MGIHYTHWMHRLNINNNSVVWPEQQNLALRRWLMLKHPLSALVARLGRIAYCTAGPDLGGVTL
jgi:hypothetical protein